MENGKEKDNNIKKMRIFIWKKNGNKTKYYKNDIVKYKGRFLNDKTIKKCN